jgi:hypothetical protein
MAARVARDRPDGAVLHVRIEPAAGKQFVELAPALARDEPAIIDLLEPGLARELVGSRAGEENVRPLLHQPPGEADRGARRRQSGDCAGAPVAAVHDRGVELDYALAGQHAAAAGIEAGIVLERSDARFDCVEGGATARENRCACIECRAKSFPGLFVMVGIAVLRPHRARAAVDHQLPARRHALGHSRRIAAIPVDGIRSDILL